MNWKPSGLLALALGVSLLWPGPKPAAAQPQEMTEAQVDSLVWYVEQLEADLQLCQIRAGARADSLTLRLDFTTERLEWAEEDRRKWYQDPRLWFLVGAVSTTFVMSGALQLSF